MEGGLRPKLSRGILAAMTPPDAVEIVFPPHVLPAVACIVLALVVLALLCAVIAGEKRRRW